MMTRLETIERIENKYLANDCEVTSYRVVDKKPAEMGAHCKTRAWLMIEVVDQNGDPKTARISCRKGDF